MTKKMAICNIQYTFENYANVDVEKLAWRIHDYAEREFAEFRPMVSEPGCGVDTPDYVDVMLCKKDSEPFIEADIRRRAVNIPRECQRGGLVLYITIQNSDGTSYHFKHHYPSRNWQPSNVANGMRQLKIKKTIAKSSAKEADGSTKGNEIGSHNGLRFSKRDLEILLNLINQRKR